MATTEEIDFVRHEAKEEAGKRTPERARGRAGGGARGSRAQTVSPRSLPSSGADGRNGETARQRESTGHHPTASQAAGRESHSTGTLTSKPSFHFENGILNNAIGKEVHREAREMAGS